MELEMNPYVLQIDKLVRSLGKLSEMSLKLEEPVAYVSGKDYEQICTQVREQVCQHCEHRNGCIFRNDTKMQEIIHEVLNIIENYGAELNIELKRKMQKKCSYAPHFLRVVVETYRQVRQKHMWEQKISQNREHCAVQLDRFAKIVQHSTRELRASIFEDEHLEKKIKTKLGKMGVKMLSSVFFVSSNGRYEIHVTVKSSKGECVASKAVADIISECTGRNMFLGKEERMIVNADYQTLTCVEGTKFQTLQGVAKIGKGCEKISGDNFSMIDLSGGKQVVILSDGMGAGQVAHRESAMVVEVLEDLLCAGFPKETALQMLNTTMVMGREEVRFSTIDMHLFDQYSGVWEIAKAGASTTFWKRENGVEQIRSTSLPLGVMPNVEIDYMKNQMKDGEYVVLVTDGVMDALPVGEQDFLMRMIIEGTKQHNPKEMAHHILEQVLECSGEVPMDDMTVLVVGIWNLEK